MFFLAKSKFKFLVIFLFFGGVLIQKVRAGNAASSLCKLAKKHPSFVVPVCVYFFSAEGRSSYFVLGSCVGSYVLVRLSEERFHEITNLIKTKASVLIECLRLGITQEDLERARGKILLVTAEVHGERESKWIEASQDNKESLNWLKEYRSTITAKQQLEERDIEEAQKFLVSENLKRLEQTTLFKEFKMAAAKAERAKKRIKNFNFRPYSNAELRFLQDFLQKVVFWSESASSLLTNTHDILCGQEGKDAYRQLLRTISNEMLLEETALFRRFLEVFRHIEKFEHEEQERIRIRDSAKIKPGTPFYPGVAIEDASRFTKEHNRVIFGFYIESDGKKDLELFRDFLIKITTPYSFTASRNFSGVPMSCNFTSSESSLNIAKKYNIRSQSYFLNYTYALHDLPDRDLSDGHFSYKNRKTPYDHLLRRVEERISQLPS